MESDRVQARGVIMREAKNGEDAADAEGGWLDWLDDCGVAGDHRRRHPRPGAPHPRPRRDARRDLPAEVAEAEAREGSPPSPDGRAPTSPATVTPGEPIEIDGRRPARGRDRHRDQALIIRQLRERGCRLTLLPCSAPPRRCSDRDPDLVFLANGPGDPAALDYVVETVRGVVGKRRWSGSASATSSSAGRSASRPSSSRSATAAPTTRSRTWPPAGSTSPRRTTASPSAARRRADDRGRRAGPLGDRLRRRRAHPPEPLRPHGRGAGAERRPRLHGPVPPRGRGPARTTPATCSTASLEARARAERASGRGCLGATTSQKILLIGSGPIVIGQAAEFDYSGVQACKVLLEEGYEVVLVNSNPATIMTDPEFADRTYVEPLLPDRWRRSSSASARTRCCRPSAARRRSTWPRRCTTTAPWSASGSS